MSEVLETVATQFVFDIEDLDSSDTRLFGGKATGLARMVDAGIPVPPAFAISTDAFRAFQANGRRMPDSLRHEVDVAIAKLSEKAGRTFCGDGLSHDPLLVSIRSGAQISMPGMMDTVLNLGLDAKSASNIIRRTGRRRFVVDSYLRFWKMFIEIVLGLDGEEFQEELASARAAAEAEEGSLDALEAAVVAFVAGQGEETPTNPREQLDRAIAAVFQSWNSPRAKAYRDHQGIAHDLGTAVTVQAMVFGNAEGESGSGVAFSRNPNTGEPVLYGEYLVGRQGEDIVSGAQTPVDLSVEDEGHAELRRQLERHSRELERLYQDAVDIEFTLESGRLYLLQVRPAKRTAAAAVRIVLDLIEEGLLSPAEGLRRVKLDQIARLLRPIFSQHELAAANLIATGIGSSPGQATGVAVIDSDRAAELAETGTAVILVRPTTSPLDIRGMLAASGILTAKGGALSHAAVVSRALDRPCVVGCEALDIDEAARKFTLSGRVFEEGDYIAIDGATGQVYDRKIQLTNPDGGAEGLERLLEYADELSQTEIWTTSPPRQGSDVPGVAVLNLTDAALARGLIDQLIEGVAILGQGKDPNGDKLAGACSAIGAAIMDTTEAKQLHLRLPQPNSGRARSLIPAWPELDQRLFLPIGNPIFQRAMLRGLDAAFRGSGRNATVLLGGVTDIAEWQIYAKELEAFETITGGVIIQNPAGLESVGAIAAAGAMVWIDIDEVINASNGFLQKSHISDSVVDDYVLRCGMSQNPRASFKPFLSRLLSEAAQAENSKAILLSSAVDQHILVDLFRKGFRVFSVAPGQRETTRLILGQACSEI